MTTFTESEDPAHEEYIVEEQDEVSDSQIRADSPPLEQQHVLDSESKPIFRESTSEVRLCVIKLPRTRNYDKWTAKHIKGIFENERDFLRRVKPEHRHIVRYFEITDNFIFMEHCPLGCLEDYIKKPDVKPPVLEWTIQLCTVLVYLHDLGWAHNQLYPCNILVCRDGSELKVCDFDAVTPAKVAGGGTNPAAPELWITQKQTEADYVTDAEGHLCDVYSLGLITWFLQHGGKEIPDNHIWTENGTIAGDYVPSHLELLDTDGLELADFMRSCWVHYKSRPTSTVLLERLHSERQRCDTPSK